MSSAVNPAEQSNRGTHSGSDIPPDPGVPSDPGDDHSVRRVTHGSRAVVAEQRERFGGMKFGACFFGWLTATGTLVLLAAVASAIGAAFGLGRGLDVTPNVADVQTAGLVGGIVLAVIIFVAYVAGGYVAGRMARFNGLKQGFGVWLWAIVMAVVIAIVSAIAGATTNLFGSLTGIPGIPIDGGTWTTAGIIIAAALLVIALLGALVGGLAGMRFHRRVDRATHDSL